MMILGIETSTKTGSVAVASDTGVVAQYSLNIETTHSERLLSTVDRVLADTGRVIADLDGLAVAIGPGSFTGLRIGLATVKGLALASGKPVAAVPTLHALAANLPYARHAVCPLLDARKGEVYAALFRHEDDILVQDMPETVLSLAQLASRVRGKTIFTGEGALLFRAELEKLLGDAALFAPPSTTLPSAATVAQLGMHLLAGGEGADIDSLAPRYIRRPEAEVMWEKNRRSR